MARSILLLVALVVGLSFGLGVAQGRDDRLAIKGYDPVAYFTDAKPTIGDQRYEYEWDGVVYHFASAKHLELFKTDPDRYAPQYQNWCTAALARGYRLAPDPNYWLIHEGRLYLFSLPVGPARFAADPTTFISNANANYPRVSQLPEMPRQ
jgi:YHS domain-containing protein